MIRKKGKLPGNVIEENYTLEYGNNIQEIQTKSVLPNQKVAIIDDLLATGGTAASAARLVEKL
jgi:adenine phosphoribosyltransferase